MIIVFLIDLIIISQQQLKSVMRNIHCVSKKNIPDVFSYNSRKHCQVFIIFGRNISKKASNQKMLYFPTSPN